MNKRCHFIGVFNGKWNSLFLIFGAFLSLSLSGQTLFNSKESSLVLNDLKRAQQIAVENPDSSNKILLPHRKVLLTKGMPKLAFEVFTEIGDNYLRLGQEGQSVEFFLLAKEQAETLGDSALIYQSYFNVGSIWLALREVKEAERSFNPIIKHYGRYHGPFNQADSIRLLALYNNMGLIYTERGNYLEAAQYLRIGLQRGEGSNLKGLIGQLYMNYADVLRLQKNNASALENYRTAADIFSSIGDEIRVAHVQYLIGNLFLDQNKMDSANYRYSLGLQKAEETGYSELSHLIYEALYHHYDSLGTEDSTYKYLKALYEISIKDDKPLAREKLAKYKELQVLIESHNKTEQVYRKTIMLIIMISIVISFLIFYLTIRRNKKYRKTRQNELVKLQRDSDYKKIKSELEVLQKELAMKEKTLAAEAMYKMQKNAIIEGVIDRLVEHYERDDIRNRDFIRGILRDLKKSAEDDVWSDFETRFKQVHESFYESLMKAHPNLTVNEKRLCAFLKLDMTSKEISAITGQSVNSILVARSRLRKKMELVDSGDSLVSYLSKFN